METISIVPALRKDRNFAGNVNIVIRVIVKRRVVKTLATGIRINPANWDEEKRVILPKEENAKLYNIKIDREIARLNKEFTTKELLGATLTKNRVKQIAEGKDTGRDFYAFCDTWLPEKYKNKETLRTYKSEVTKLKDYATSLSFGDMDYKFLTNYKNYMEGKRGNSPNTVFKSFKFINTMMIDALKIGGIIDRNPFKDFDRGKYTDPDKMGIQLSECDKIRTLIDKPDTAPMLRWVAAKFLLMCYAGLRYEDAMRFDPDVHTIDGTRLQIKTQKKGVQLNLKLYTRLSDVIQLLRDNPRPRINNQEFNKWLKTVASAIDGTSVPLTCHRGKHTFGELLAEMEIPIEQAKELLAHKDIRSTRVYYKIKGKALDRAMDKLNAM